MKYNFETLINRSKQGSSKWNLMKPGTPENIAPFSVADVDMPLAPEIKNGLIKFLENDAVLGYTNPNDEYYQAVINWMARRHNYKIDKEMVVLSNGIVPALYDAILAYTNKNDGVITFTPIYYPFYQAIEINDRSLLGFNLKSKYALTNASYAAFTSSCVAVGLSNTA